MMKQRHRADDLERRRWQNPEAIMTAIGIHAGMTFIDAGCGEGYFALPAARKVGTNGKVFAFDIDADAISILKGHAADEGLTNLSAEVGTAEESQPCRRCADFVFFGINLHDFANPMKAITNATVMLKSSGRLIDLDWKAIPMDFGPPAGKRFPEDKARDLIAAAGLRILSVQDAGPWHYLIIAGL